MQRRGDAVTLLSENKIQYLVGGKEINILPTEIFSDQIGSFLDDLSRTLRESAAAQSYSDIQAFAFWIRKSNFYQLKERMDKRYQRIGRGLVFHIAPSNVPINFAYSLVFGMISGNVNIVRVSSKSFAQVDIVCQHISQLLQEKYKALQKNIIILKYEADKEITDYYSSICHARVIWGGDNTIRQIRKSPLMPRAVEINFADRFSFAIIDPEAVLQLDSTRLGNLALNFYNDTYLMDQNACTAPHVLFWKKSTNIKEASARFWQAVYTIVKEKYLLEGIKTSDKFTELYKYLARYPIENLKKYDNYIYVITLNHIDDTLESCRGKYGLFYEMELQSYDDIACKINEKVQTCAYFGIDRQEIVGFIFKQHLTGIDRIVPIGKTLDIDLVWDGYDIVGNLSRIIG